MKKRLFNFLKTLALVMLPNLMIAQTTNPVPVQFYYVPIPEDQLLTVLQTVATSGTPAANPVQTYISIAAIANGTVIYYDHWENGYDPDISNPLNLYSTSNPGGTQIWGDGNTANGAPPGFPSDIINAGNVIILNNPVTTTNLSAIDYDGRDKIAASKTVAVVRSGWATGPNTLLAAANETSDTSNWGTSFVVPVGQNMPTSFDNRLFNYTGLSIMAGVGGANVQVDANADGSYELTFSLTEGQARLVNGDVNVGAKILASKPVQIDLLTGDVGETYETRFFNLTATSLLYNEYYNPVSTASSVGTVVFLYNPGTSSMTVNYTTRTGSGGNTLTTTGITLSAGGYAKQVIPEGYGAKFVSTNGAPFHALSATDATGTSNNTGDNKTWDWGFTLVGKGSLTSQVLVGLGIGRDPTSSTNPTENGNPVWVTPVGNGNTAVTVYADFDANPSTGPNTDPNGNKYNVSFSLRELDRALIYDNLDRNQTGMLVYTLTNGVKLAAAWGQDPNVASSGEPGLDMGTGVPPAPEYDAGKNGILSQDNDGDGFISPGDEILYKIVINNISRAPVPDVLLFDNLPLNTLYKLNSTYFKNAFGVTSQIPDNGSGTAFPLDGSGVFLDPSALPVGSSYEVTFKVTIKNYEDLEPGTTHIINTGDVSAIGTTIDISAQNPLYGLIGNFLWNDANHNGLQDATEAGISGITVKLYDDSGNLLKTTTTDTDGKYLFTGLLSGNYQVEFVKPSTYDFTIKNADSQGLNGAANSDADLITGRTGIIALAGGERNRNIDAGLIPNGSIGDKVWNDANHNGIQDQGEAGISGVTVKLYNCNDNLITQTTTDVNDNYKFSNLAPGSYYVQFVLPSGYAFTSLDQGTDNNIDSDANTTTGKTECTPLSLGQTITNMDAGLIPSGSIGDKVWNDTNHNGIQDQGEAGISGVTVKLYDCNDNPIRETTTDTEGLYTFTNLAPGSYYVQFVLPTGYNFTSINQGSDDNLDSDANTTTGKTECTPLSLGQTITNMDAGLIPSGSIGDKVWNDTNHNGIQDQGEAGISGVTVKLYDCNDNPIRETTTDTDGLYTFTNLAPGSYYVQFVLPTGYNFTSINQGSDDNLDSDANTTTGKTECTPLSLGQTITNMDAGLIPSGSIGDKVWNDTNHNGIQDQGEAGISGVTVKLYDCNDNPIRETTTDTDGLYTFTNLAPGSYYVQFVLPTGYNFTSINQGSDDNLDSDANTTTGKTECTPLSLGQTITNMDAGLIPSGSIGDKVWNDTNHNGIQDQGEAGISGVTVKLYDCNDNPIRETTTDTDGLYTFTNLAPGSYYVQFVLPTGYNFTSINQGSDDNLDSDANTTTGKTECTPLSLGQTITNMDAGLIPNGSIGDRVWNDTNHNGIQDQGEAGISGVTVKLYDCNDNPIRETTTDTNGNYIFTSLAPGSYYVQFVLPTGYNFTSINQGSDDNLDSDANTTTGKTECTPLSLGQTITNMDAGLIPSGSIGDKVWNDTNHNGIQDQGEAGISGVTVKLYDCNDNPIRETTTDTDGLYTFTNLAPGSYYVQFVLPTGYNFTSINQGSDDNLDSDANTTTGKTECTPLSLGQTITNMDAGLIPSGSIGDRVWNDTNHNGIQDQGEAGISGVTVKLYDCNDNPIRETTTDTNGNYIFTSLAPGSYYVQFVLPTGYNFTSINQGSDDNLDSDANTTTGKTECTPLSLGQTITNMDAGLIPSGSIGDKVWNDTNHNGIQDQGEAGISGVTVKLYECNDNPIRETTTDTDGLYTITNLAPGSYYVQFVLPTGYNFTSINQGSDDNLDSDANTTTGKTECTPLSLGQTITNMDAGLIPNGSIGDKVWNDTNHNGIQDQGEAGIPNVTVELRKCSDNGVVATTTTDVNGAYLFSNRTSGDYYVQFVVPSGYTVSLANQGTDTSLDSNPDATGKTLCITLATGENNLTIDAGLYPTPPASADLQVEKTVNNSNPNCGDNVTFSIKVTNLGPNTSTGIVVGDLLPAGLNYVSSTPSQGTYNQTTGVWNVGTLASGSYATLSITAKVDCSGLSGTSIDLGPAIGYNVFVLEDITQPSADTQGKVAVGRDANFSGYTLGNMLPPGSGDVLVVGHNLTYNSGSIHGGNVVYGNTTNLPRYSVTITDGTVRQDNVIDFAAAALYLQNLSATLGAYTVNGTTTMAWGGITLTGTDPFLNVFKIHGSDLSNAHTVIINAPNGSVVLVNIDGTNVSWTGGLFVNGASISSTLYNFYEATNLNISGINIQGVVLAPFAHLNFPAGLITGQVIVKSMIGSGQFNLNLFTGYIPADKKITNIATILSTNTTDPNANNNSSSATITIGGTTTGVEDEGGIPTEVKLAQNYPNPFNPTTVINFGLPQTSYVTIKIFDMLGKEVRTLVHEEKSAGYYNIRWNGNNDFGSKVSSGTYIYRIQAGSFIQNRKMILMK